MNNRLSLTLALIVGLLAISNLLFFNPMVERRNSVYSTEKLNPVKLKGLKFTDVTKEWGIEYTHQLFWSTRSLAAQNPAVTIYDFDGNGFVDIFYTGGAKGWLYLNKGNGKFEESLNTLSLPVIENGSMVALADLNRDGATDIYYSAFGKHHLFYGTKDRKNFEDKSSLLNGYASFPEAVNFVDFNKDGFLDVVVGNFVELERNVNYTSWYMPRRYASKGGGENHLLLQKTNGTFAVEKKVDFLTRAYTHSVGISDVNNDGYPDIFFANDYDKDQMFENVSGKTVKEITSTSIPYVWHGNSGMNAEFADFNQDGHIDLYVTYIHKPPFYRAYNTLWLKNPGTNIFRADSWDKNIGKCGFSWGAKAADFNLDGELDLFVINGRDRDHRIKRPEEGKSFWYIRSQLTSMPNFLLPYIENFSRNMNEKYYNSAFERDCLFIKDNGEYYDVAVDVGLTDEQEGRGLAIGDLNNDGRMDMVVTNIIGTSKVYLNESIPVGSWIGFVLHDKNGNDLPIGAFIRLKQSHGPDLVREYYPANGYRGQSDHRLLFGLAKGSRPVSLEVTWPLSGKKIIYRKFDPEKYNDIFEQEPTLAKRL